VDVSALRMARISRGLSLGDLSRTTRMSPAVIAAIDAGRLWELPAGIYARTFLRTYCEAVGLDSTDAVAALEGQLPPARLDLLELAELRKAPSPGRDSRPFVAALVDAGVLCLLDGAIIMTCGWVCGIAPVALFAAAPAAIVLLCTMPPVLYFCLLGATDVRTAGPWLLDVEILPRASGPIRLPELLRRGGRYVRSELQLAVPWRTRRKAPVH
jgi:hypothetical protein